MKTLLSIVVLCLICMHVWGQEKKNAVKVLPVSLPLNSVVFEYERMLNEKNAVEFGIGLPVERTFVDKFGMDLNEDDDISNDKLGIFSFRAAYRHYTGKSMLPKGFYIAPYIRYLGVSGSFDMETVEDEPESSSFNENYDVKINTFGAGCQLGYQFLISKTVTLDLFFFGLEAGLGEIDANIYISDPEQVGDTYNDIKDAINDLPAVWGDKIDVSSGSSKVSVNGKKLFYPMYRGGISLGIVF
jgi:hypothetical protein